MVIYDQSGGVATKRSLPALIVLFIATALMATDLTVIFLAMRSVMEVGGSCADGGPYVSVQSCPDGAGAAMAIGIPGLFVIGGLLIWASAKSKAPQIIFLAWPALFISLGWNFLEFAYKAPNSPEVGFLVCGIVFMIMGGGPLIFGFFAARKKVKSSPKTPQEQMVDLMRQQAQRSGGRDQQLRNALSYLESPSGQAAGQQTYGQQTYAQQTYGQQTYGQPQHHSPGAQFGSPNHAGSTGHVVSDLERLASLRSSGALTDAEFEAAKQAALRRGEQR